MTVTIVNRGVNERDTSGRKTANLTKTFGNQGTVRVVVENIEYVFGPGETKSFSDDGLGLKIAAADARLGLSDTREGFRTTGRS